MTELKLAFIGFGNVARSFARMLDGRKGQLSEQYGINWRTTAIATSKHGCVITERDIDLIEAAACVEGGESLLSLPRISSLGNTVEVIEGCDADIVFETTPLNPASGDPAI